jgi:serine/threonine-protein kinase
LKTCTSCGAEWPDDTKFCPNDGTTLRSAEGADLIGSVVADSYHIEKKLGEGGMGAVYLAEHVKMGRKSAIKVMAQSMANDPEAIARFNREAANAGRINHPNVCAIYDFGETSEGIIYLAMEFIKGESLSDLLHREGALPPERAVRILQQTADALQAAHDLGIVHRDLKPDNIMLAKGRGGSDVVKVVDFGIAKAMTGEEGQKVTKTGLVVGTPEYMSPEQLSGDVLDGRSDIYSLALVFYRMLSANLPFKADSAQEMMIKRLTDKPRTLNEVVAGGNFPNQLQQTIDKALERMPGDRYTSAVEFATDAEASVRGFAAAPQAATDAATQLIDTGPSEGITEEMLPDTQVSVSPKAAAPAAPPAEQATPATPTTPAPVLSPAAAPRKKKPIAAIIGAVVVIAGGGGGLYAVMTGGGGDAPSQPAVEDTTGTVENVTGDTASQPGGTEVVGRPGGEPQGDEQQGTGEPAGATDDPPTDRDPPAAALDTAAVSQQLVDLGRQIRLPSARVEARQELEAVYGNQVLPAKIRARAASIIAESYEEGNDNRPLDACRWIANAIALDPENESFRTYQSVILVCQ